MNEIGSNMWIVTALLAAKNCVRSIKLLRAGVKPAP